MILLEDEAVMLPAKVIEFAFAKLSDIGIVDFNLTLLGF